MGKMFRFLLCVSVINLLLTVSIASAAGKDDFIQLKGGTKPKTMKVTESKAGITVVGQGSYSPEDQAAGIIYKKAVSPKDVTVEFTINKIPTLNPIKGSAWTQARDSWYTVSIMDKPEYWTTANDKVKSFSLAISPISRDRAYVHLYRTFAGGFTQMNWLATIPCKPGSKMVVNIKWVGKKVSATINKTEIPLDSFNEDQLETIDPVFGDKVYVAVAGQTGAKEASFTLTKINKVAFTKKK